jgi:hypothetical protein
MRYCALYDYATVHFMIVLLSIGRSYYCASYDCDIRYLVRNVSGTSANCVVVDPYMP